jgi:prepilin-type N-terminal cleavage/methylation domain-containing protein
MKNTTRKNPEKKTPPGEKSKTNPDQKANAFTIVELVIVVTILALLAALAIPEALQAHKESKAAACGAALLAIEAAKDQWRHQYPGARNPTEEELKVFFAGGQLPSDPWGVGFQNVTNLDAVASHPYDNNPFYEPKGNCAPDNGYNDANQLQRNP